MIIERKYKLMTNDKAICNAIEESHYQFDRPRLPKAGFFFRTKEEEAAQQESDKQYERSKWIEVFTRAKELYPELFNQPGVRNTHLIAVGRTRCGEHHFTIQVDIEVCEQA